MVACSVSERLLRRRSPDDNSQFPIPNSQESVMRPWKLEVGRWELTALVQKSIWALNFMKRACNTLFGRSHVSVVGTKVWL